MDYPDSYTCPERGRLRLRGSAHRDLEAMARIDRLSFEEPISHERLKKRAIKGWAYVIEADRQSDAVAYLLAGRGDKGVVRIQRIAVHPAFRRIGLATWLIVAQCGVLRSPDEWLITAKVPENNTPAQLLLQKAGFLARGGLVGDRIRMSLGRDEWIGCQVLDRLARGETRVLNVV